VRAAGPSRPGDPIGVGRGWGRSRLTRRRLLALARAFDRAEAGSAGWQRAERALKSRLRRRRRRGELHLTRAELVQLGDWKSPRIRPRIARNTAAAKEGLGALDAFLAQRGSRVDAALLIDVPAEDLVKRLSGRWICQAAGHPYHAAMNPPRVAGTCDVDGSPLVQRGDDRPETIRARLASQLADLDAVVEHYRSTGALRTVDGLRPIADVSAGLLGALDAIATSTPRPG